MNNTRLKCLLAISVLAMIGFGPISLTCLIGLFIVIRRPCWFRVVVSNLYADVPALSPPRQRRGNTNGVRLKCLLSLILLFILDIAPVPVAGSIGLYVVIMRPDWFRQLVEDIYGGI